MNRETAQDTPLTLGGLSKALPFAILFGTMLLGFAGVLTQQAVMQANIQAMKDANEKADLASTQRMDAFQKGLTDENIKSYSLDSRLSKVETTLQVKGLLSKLPDTNKNLIAVAATPPPPSALKSETTPTAASATLIYNQSQQPSPGPTPTQSPPNPTQAPSRDGTVTNILKPILNILP